MSKATQLQYGLHNHYRICLNRCCEIEISAHASAFGSPPPCTVKQACCLYFLASSCHGNWQRFINTSAKHLKIGTVMKTVEEQLSNYKSVHFNQHNIMTHFIGIPLIVWAVTVLLSLHTFTLELEQSTISYTPAMIFFTITLLYYFKLHLKLALGMLVYIAINLYLASLVTALDSALSIAIIVFIVGWILQFIGHIYEKAKPAFLDDLMGLVIGPFFLMAEIYFALGLEQKLHNEITAMAVTKRRTLESAKAEQQTD